MMTKYVTMSPSPPSPTRVAVATLKNQTCVNGCHSFENTHKNIHYRSRLFDQLYLGLILVWTVTRCRHCNHLILTKWLLDGWP